MLRGNEIWISMLEWHGQYEQKFTDKSSVGMKKVAELENVCAHTSRLAP